MSDSAVCFTATAVGLTALVLADKLVAGYESRHRSAYSAETDNDSMVIGESALAHSMQNGLGAISENHGPATTVLFTPRFLIQEIVPSLGVSPKAHLLSRTQKLDQLPIRTP